jgi:hypothetical protein
MACRPSAACLHLAAKQFQQAAHDHLVHGVVVHRQDPAQGLAVVRHRKGLARQRRRQARIDVPGKGINLRRLRGSTRMSTGVVPRACKAGEPLSTARTRQVTGESCVSRARSASVVCADSSTISSIGGPAGVPASSKACASCSDGSRVTCQPWRLSL